jgi:hypothetical protein
MLLLAEAQRDGRLDSCLDTQAVTGDSGSLK